MFSKTSTPSNDQTIDWKMTSQIGLYQCDVQQSDSNQIDPIQSSLHYLDISELKRNNVPQVSLQFSSIRDTHTQTSITQNIDLSQIENGTEYIVFEYNHELDTLFNFSFNPLHAFNPPTHLTVDSKGLTSLVTQKNSNVTKSDLEDLLPSSNFFKHYSAHENISKPRGANVLDKEKSGLRFTEITGEKGSIFKLINSVTRSLLKSGELSQEIENHSKFKPRPLSSKNKKIKAILGHGGTGKVRLAQNKETNEVVAVKKGSHFAGRREVDAYNTLQSRLSTSDMNNHFITILDYAHARGKDGVEKFYIFEEYADGGNLDKQFGRWKTPAKERLTIAKAILKPVALMHQSGLYHRDLKPENYLVVQQKSLFT